MFPFSADRDKAARPGRAGRPPGFPAPDDDALRFPALDAPVKADVLIIGGGYTGLSAALHLAEAGIDTVLVEADRIGQGASGRNGGQLHSGQRRDQDWIENRLGTGTARQLWDLAEEAKGLVHSLIARHDIACDFRAGLIETVHKQRLVEDERAYVDKLRERYGYAPVEWLSREALAATTGTDAYFGGRRDMGAGHLSPYKFAAGLARAAAKAGARIFETTRAQKITRRDASGIEVACLAPDWTMRTGEKPAAGVRAEIVILAGNGYLEDVEAETEAHVMPIDNYILATAPIGAGKPGGILAGGEAVSDTRFVVYYFRPTADGGLIFGGGETYSRSSPADIAGFVRGHLKRIYPQLAETPIDHAWGGRLAITMNRLPFIRRVQPGLYAAAGYSGQGVALAPFAGKLIADAINANPAKLDFFANLPTSRFPGGQLLRYPALVAGMSWYALRDRL